MLLQPQSFPHCFSSCLSVVSLILIFLILIKNFSLSLLDISLLFLLSPSPFPCCHPLLASQRQSLMFHLRWLSVSPDGCSPSDNHHPSSPSSSPPFFLALYFLFRAVSDKQIYTTLPKLDEMSVQLFPFIAAYFSLHQNCSCSLPWWKQHRKEPGLNAEETTYGVFLAVPWWPLDNQMWEGHASVHSPSVTCCFFHQFVFS